MFSEPLVSGFKPLPSRNLDVQTRLGPFRVTWWFVKFIELREKGIHEVRHPTIAIRLLRPIEAHEQYAGRKRVDRLAWR